MKYSICIILILALYLTQIESRLNFQSNKYQHSGLYPGQKTYWFEEQYLDHFDYKQPQTQWKQRYHVYEKSFEKAKGPLILCIGGEGPENGVSEGGAFPIQLAQKMNGIVISLEHRFYGESQPFGQNDNSYSIENLQYLTYQQALADIANFLSYLKANGKFGISETTPVITIGGSYPGALSAWFRYKYPHQAIGALASSAVVEALEDFWDYDKQIRISTAQQGWECPDKIHNLAAYADEQLYNNGEAAATAFKKRFGAEKLNNGDFLYYYADLFAGEVQYGQTSNLCNNVLQGTIEEQLDNVVSQLKDKMITPEQYDQEKLKITKYNKNTSSRQWTYQTCTTFGWFQTYDTTFWLRSPHLNVKYFEDLCENVYGKGYIPQDQQTNDLMGGKYLDVDNLIFTNGVEDPWKWVSITELLPYQSNMHAFLNDCKDCGHCVEFQTQTKRTPKSVKQNQDQILYLMQNWLGSYWENFESVQQQEQK